jgi:heat shock protein HtpX
MSIFSAQDKARQQTYKLMAWFLLTIIALVVGVNVGLALMWWPLTRIGIAYPHYFFTVNTVVTLACVLGGWWIESSNLSLGGEKLARRVGARELWDTRVHEAGLPDILQELVIAARMQPPQLMVLDREEGINAFATGWTQNDAVIALTRGALEQLNREELQGMLAHELGHIREGDTRLNMHLASMVFGLEMVYNFGKNLCSQDGPAHFRVRSIPGIIIMGAGFVGWLAGRWLRAAVARQREFTRSKDGLGGALRKAQRQALDGQASMRFAHPAVAHMWLVGASPGATHDPEEEDNPTARATWSDNHPPIAERIRRVYGHSMPRLPSVKDKPNPFAQ